MFCNTLEVDMEIDVDCNATRSDIFIVTNFCWQLPRFLNFCNILPQIQRVDKKHEKGGSRLVDNLQSNSNGFLIESDSSCGIAKIKSFKTFNGYNVHIKLMKMTIYNFNETLLNDSIVALVWIKLHKNIQPIVCAFSSYF